MNYRDLVTHAAPHGDAIEKTAYLPYLLIILRLMCGGGLIVNPQIFTG